MKDKGKSKGKSRSPARTARKPGAKPLIHRASLVFMFDKGSAILPGTETAKINALVLRMRRNPDAILVIRGHTLGRGAEAANRALGLERARAVAAKLVGRGIAARRVIAMTMGRRRSYEQLLPAERSKRRRAEAALFAGNVTELRGPDLLMEARIRQRPPSRRVA